MQISNIHILAAVNTGGLDSTVQAAIVTGICAIIGTYLTVKYKDRVISKPEKPKDRMETIFDGYENLIKQQQTEIGRKGQIITSLEGVVRRLEQELETTREMLNVARDELKVATKQNEDLQTQLADMKANYQKTGHP